jgi:hypothetical protein
MNVWQPQAEIAVCVQHRPNFFLFEWCASMFRNR